MESFYEPNYIPPVNYCLAIPSLSATISQQSGTETTTYLNKLHNTVYKLRYILSYLFNIISLKF